MRLVMMGTGTFALPAFERLIAAGRNVVGLVTQPDRTGPGHHHHANPLKELAIARGLPVFQPDKVNAAESLETLRSFQADLFVVAAYGQILSAELLQIPTRGAINLHGSLLPKYRGAAPVQYAVWKGEAETGVTIFQIEPRLDAGPMLGVVRTPIGEKETSGELHDRLAVLAADLTSQVLTEMEQGTLQPELQDAQGVTKAPRIRKTDGLVDWQQSFREIDCQVRAMQPWPMPFSFLHLPQRKPVRMLILEIEPGSMMGKDFPPGTVIRAEGDQLLVAAGEGSVRITKLQPAGKRPMEAGEFLRGTAAAGGTFGPQDAGSTT